MRRPTALEEEVGLCDKLSVVESVKTVCGEEQSRGPERWGSQVPGGFGCEPVELELHSRSRAMTGN